MSFRIEEKLYIKKENLSLFKDFLFKKSAKKIYQPRVINSLYFENKNFDMFHDSIEGLTPRKKIRVRNYPKDQKKELYFEVKNSAVEGRHKTREIIDEKEFKERKSYGILDHQYGICYPKIYVKYSREYLLIEDVRISIDENIEYADYFSNQIIRDDKVVVELKTSINKNLDDLIEDFPNQRIRFSKYCFGIENLCNLRTN